MTKQAASAIRLRCGFVPVPFARLVRMEASVSGALVFRLLA